MRPRSRLMRLLLLLVVISSVALGAGFVWRRNAMPELPDGVSTDIYRAALAELGNGTEKQPSHVDVMFLLAQRFTSESKPELAVACFDEIPSNHPEYGAEARLQQGLLRVELRHAVDAEDNLREFLDLAEAGQSISPSKVADALDMLRFLLSVELRFEERHGVLRAIHVLGFADANDTITYCFPSVLRWNGEQAVSWLEEFVEQDAEDFSLRVALGRYRTGQGRLDEAEALLKSCVAERPDDVLAQTALMACLYERADWEGMEAIRQKLPAMYTADPWLLLRLRGHIHNHFGRYDRAVGAFELALDGDPANGESNLGLGQAYAALGRSAEAEKAFHKANVIARIQNRLGWVQAKPDDVTALLEVAELAEEIGLTVRAPVIARQILKMDPGNQRATELLARIKGSPE